MVVTAIGAKDKHILDAEDVSNLRLASRCMQAITFDAFAQRFFITRKHMMSRASLECLAAIAKIQI